MRPGFAYALTGIETPQFARFQLEEYDSEQGYISSGWVTTTLTIIPPDNFAPTLRFAETVDTFDQTMGMTTRTVTGQLRDFTRTYDQYTVECDYDGDGVADAVLYQVGANEVFGFTDTLLPGAGPAMLRISEANDAGIPLVLDWVEAVRPGEMNVAPVLGADGSRVLGYGGLTADLPVHEFPAIDSDGGLKYTLQQARLPGSGSDGNFYDAIPTPGLSITGSGDVTISNPDVIKYFYERDFQFHFNVTVDDGHTTDTVGFWLIDNWEDYIETADNHIENWAITYGDVLVLTAANAEAAMDSLDGFLELNHLFVDGTTAITGVLWASAPVNPVVATVGTAITAAAAKAYADKSEEGYDAIVAHMRTLFQQITNQSLARRTEVKVAEDQALTAFANQLEESGGTPAELARQAAEYLSELRRRLNTDPKKLKAPTSTEIYGSLLVTYADDHGHHLEWRKYANYDPRDPNSDPGEWHSWDIDWLGIDGSEIVEELNRINYYGGDHSWSNAFG